MRQRLLVGVATACLLLIVLFRFVYRPMVGKMDEQRAMLQNLQVKIADAKGLAERLPIQEAALQQARERYHTLKSRFDNGQSVAHILETLKLQAQNHELTLVAVQPRADETEHRLFTLEPGTTLREMPLTLQLTGGYRQLGEFLGELLNPPLMAFVRNLTVTKPEAESPPLRADLVLAVYLAERPSSP
jgi:Tfp pilus assembly protein PilO